MAFRTAHDGNVPEGAFVGELRTRLANVVKVGILDEAETRERNGNVEFAHNHCTGRVDAFIHIESGFGREECNGGISGYAGHRADPVTGFAVKSRGHIQSQSEALAFVKPEYGVQIVAGDRAFETCAEESVHNGIGLFCHVWVGDHGAAEGNPVSKHFAGELSLGFSARHDELHRVAEALELTGADNGVAAVVAWAGKHCDVRTRQTFVEPLCGEGARPAHQSVQAHAHGAAGFEFTRLFKVHDGSTHLGSFRCMRADFAGM